MLEQIQKACGYYFRRGTVEFFCWLYEKNWSEGIKDSLAKIYSPHYQAVLINNKLWLHDAVKNGIRQGEIRGEDHDIDFVLGDEYWEFEEGMLIIECPFCGERSYLNPDSEELVSEQERAKLEKELNEAMEDMSADESDLEGFKEDLPPSTYNCCDFKPSNDTQIGG